MAKKIINRDYFKEFYDKFMEVRTKKFEGKKFLAYARESKSEIINTAIDNNIEKIRKVFEKDKANDNVLKIFKAKIVKSDEKRKPISDADIRELILADELENTNLNKIDEALVKRCRDKNSEEYIVLGEVQYEVSTALRDQFIQDVFGKLENPTSMGKIVDEYLMNKDIFLDEWNNAIEDTKKILDEKYKECNFDIDEILKNIQEPKFPEHSFIMDIGRSLSQIRVSDIGRSLSHSSVVSGIGKGVSRGLSKTKDCFGIKSSHKKDEHQDGEPAQENTAEQQPNNMEASTSDEIVGSELAEENVVNPKDVQDSAEIPTRGVSTISKEARELYNSIMEEVKASREYSGEDEDMYDILALLEGGGGNCEVQGENEQPKPAKGNTESDNYSLGNIGTREALLDMYKLDDIESIASGVTNVTAEHQDPAQENTERANNSSGYFHAHGELLDMYRLDDIASRNSEVDSNVSMSNEINMLEEQSQQDVDIQNITNEPLQPNNMEAATSTNMAGNNVVNTQGSPKKPPRGDSKNGPSAWAQVYGLRREVYDCMKKMYKENGNTSPKLPVPERNYSIGLNVKELLAKHAKELMKNEGQIGISDDYYSIINNPNDSKIEVSFIKASNSQ
ncbi:MAG: hypothetical protein K5769_09520 [Pseudobutyrivibrio sp.]|nr:hypothetical protein [Pseudobutyrivibrio sp.]